MKNQLNTETWNEALETYGLNFELEKAPLYHVGQNGQFESSPNLFGIRRTDNGRLMPNVSVSKGYEVIQTNTYADIGDKICGGMNAEFVKGGLGNGGKTAWLQAKLPDVVRVRSTNDTIQKYITFINGLGGNKAFHLLITGKRIWCENEIPALVQDGKALKIRHTKSASDRLGDADEIIMEANGLFRGFETKVNWLADQKFTDAQMMLLARRMFNVADDTDTVDIPTRTSNNIARVRQSFEDGIGLTQWRGTGWGAMNACTEFYSHHQSLRKNTDRTESNLFGSGALGMNKAFNILDKMIAEG